MENVTYVNHVHLSHFLYIKNIPVGGTITKLPLTEGEPSLGGGGCTVIPSPLMGVAV